MVSLTIITINTWKGDGDYYNRLRALKEQLFHLDADIVLCQECFKCVGKKADTIEQLGEHLGMYFDYVGGRNKKRYFDGDWIESESGLGILSRYPVISSNNFDLPLAAGDEVRKVQQVEIELPDGEIIGVSNVHLTHITSSQNYRLAQVNFLVNCINKQPGNGYYFIGGDFNALPGSKEIAALKEGAGLLDCYEAANTAAKRFSLADAYEQGEMRCVDYIFTKTGLLSDRKIFIENASVVLNEKDLLNRQYPSDHFGISIHVKLKQ